MDIVAFVSIETPSLLVESADVVLIAVAGSRLPFRRTIHVLSRLRFVASIRGRQEARFGRPENLGSNLRHFRTLSSDPGLVKVCKNPKISRVESTRIGAV